MPRKMFSYLGIANISICGPDALIERIADNIEDEISTEEPIDCRINIHQSENPSVIKKDKRFDYLTMERLGGSEKPSIRYTRYNTYVRTIHQETADTYRVDANIALDEASGLICVRHYLRNNLNLISKPLLHASLINSDGKGILIAGDSHKGKTTTMVYFIEEQGAVFIGDENIILEDNAGKVYGFYVPKTVRVRFSTIAESGLSTVLKNIRLTNATQYIDSDAIKKIIDTQSYHVDAGIAFSRGAFCRLLGVTSQESSKINIVIFPNINSERNPTLKSINFDEGIERLSKIGLVNKFDIDLKEFKKALVDLQRNSFKDVEFWELNFSGIKALRKMKIRL